MMRRLAVALLCSFALGVYVVRAGNTVLNVPFIAQKPNYCGPAALAMLANYYGHAVTQD